MSKEIFDISLFEQYWVNARHVESGRYWIMGIWLGITGIMLKELWMPNEAVTRELISLKLTAVAHLFITLGILLIILKIHLELSKNMKCVEKMSENATKDIYRVKPLWKIITLRKGLVGEILRCFLTVGGVMSIILVSGIFLDINLLSVRDRKVCLDQLFQNWILAFSISLGTLVAYRLLFRILEEKLDKEMEMIEQTQFLSG